MIPKGTQIVFIPNHANGDKWHPDSRFGFTVKDHKEEDEELRVVFFTPSLVTGVETGKKSKPVVASKSNITFESWLPQKWIDDELKEYLNNG
jgi:hypothetical protein